MKHTCKWLALVGLILGATAQAKEKERDPFKAPHRSGELLIGYKNSAASLRSTLAAEGIAIKQTFSAGAITLVQPAEDSSSMRELYHRLKNHPDIAFVEPNYLVTTLGRPDDPEFWRQYGLENTGKTKGKPGVDVNIVSTWDTMTGNKDTIIALLDTGVDLAHEDLDGNIWQNPGETGLDAEGQDKASNGKDDDGNGFIDDVKGWNFIEGNNTPQDNNSHGTHIAGIIGAEGNNGIGVAGVNWEASILPLKVLSDQGSGALSEVIAGIEYAKAAGAKIFNMSFHLTEASEALKTAINSLEGVVVTASGSGSNPSYPADLWVPNVMGVVSTDDKGQVAPNQRFSNAILAPGVKIYSTLPGNRYGYQSGSSMAAGFVSGALALLAKQYPNKPMRELANLMRLRTRSLLLVTNAYGGAPYLDIKAALETDDIPPAAPTGIRVTEPTLGGFTVSFPKAGDDNEDGEASYYRFAVSPVVDSPDGPDSPNTPFPSWGVTTEAEEHNGVIYVKVNGLDYNSKTTVSIVAVDNVGNQSSATTVEAATKPLTEHSHYDGGSFAGLEATGRWGTIEAGITFPGPLPWPIPTPDGEEEPEEPKNQVYTDSPEGNYQPFEESALQLAPVALEGLQHVIVSYMEKFAFEENMDFGFVEFSTDNGENWQLLTQVTGYQEWRTTELTIPKEKLQGTTLLVRFRLSSDIAEERDGWLLDDIRVMTESTAAEEVAL